MSDEENRPTDSAGEGGELKTALDHFDDDWKAGPLLPDDALEAIRELRGAGLIERRFLDKQPAQIKSLGDGFSAHISACWHFRLTDAGRTLKGVAS